MPGVETRPRIRLGRPDRLSDRRNFNGAGSILEVGVKDHNRVEKRPLQFEKQAEAYRKLVAERAARYGPPAPSPPPRWPTLG